MSGYAHQEAELCQGLRRTPFERDRGELSAHELALLVVQAVASPDGEAEARFLGTAVGDQWQVSLADGGTVVCTPGIIQAALHPVVGGGVCGVEAAINQYGQALTGLANGQHFW